MSKYVDPDALITMIQELQKYREDLSNETAYIANSADYCDAVLGEDEISKKYISRIGELVDQLNAVQNMAYDVQLALQNDLRHANIIVE